MNNGYAPFDAQTGLLPDKSDVGQKRAVIKEGEASIEAALFHASVGIAVTLLMCWLVAVTFMIAKPALGPVCCRCNNGPLYKCDLAKCTGYL